MKLLSKQMPTSFNLFLFGDTHIGTILFDQEAFGEFMETVTQPFEGVKACHNYLAHHGDAIEAITVDDMRYDAKLVKDP